jgi:hypothetical protein
MKTRKGFVSNSSSSSFIVGFEKKPESEEEMHDVLFPDGEQTVYTSWDGKTGWSSRQAAARVFVDIQNQKPLILNTDDDDNVIVKEFEDYSVKYDKEYDNIWEKSPRVQWALIRKQDEEVKRRAAEHAAQFVEGLKDRELYWFNYADDGGEAWLEHGDIFRNLPHKQTSHH